MRCCTQPLQAQLEYSTACTALGEVAYESRVACIFESRQRQEGCWGEERPLLATLQQTEASALYVRASSSLPILQYQSPCRQHQATNMQTWQLNTVELQHQLDLAALSLWVAPCGLEDLCLAFAVREAMVCCQLPR